MRQFLTTTSSLKLIRNSFYFTSKAPFVLKIFKFLSSIFSRVEKRLDFKVFDVTTWETKITRHISAIISDSQLDVVKKLFPDPFPKNQHWAYLWINSLKVLCLVQSYLKMLKLSCIPLALSSYKAFLKNRKKSRTSLHALFSAWILNKNIFLVIFY